MTFSFKAIGSKAEVLAQLKAYDATNFGDLGRDVRDLVGQHIEAASGTPNVTPGDWAIKYEVVASGHGDGTSVSFKCEVTSHWVPAVKTESDAATS